MASNSQAPNSGAGGKPGSDVAITCSDGYVLAARAFAPAAAADNGATVVITTATGAKASYYWRYADYLASRGFRAVVADYRGVGRSAPAGAPRALRGLRARWHEWGTLDIDAVLKWAIRDGPGRRMLAVGHSFGGLGVCLAPSASAVERLLMVGAQHAHWRDYAAAKPGTLLRWHIAMPAIAAVLGYLPGRRLGWLEDIPRGVAFDWARGRANFADTIGRGGHAIMKRISELDLHVLAVAASDDPFATRPATERLLGYLPRAHIERLELAPAALGVEEIGHLGVFHERFRSSLWTQSADWLAGSAANSVE